MRRYFIYLFFSIFLVYGCGTIHNDHEAALPSPDFDVHLYFNLHKGTPFYLVYYKDQVVVSWSWLGFNTEGEIPLNQGLLLADLEDEEGLAVGMKDSASLFPRDVKSNSLTVKLVSETDPAAAYFIDFRSFEGGVAFRYRPVDRAGVRFKDLTEASEFNFSTPGMVWHVSKTSDSIHNSPQFFGTPLELISDDGYTVSIFEDKDPDQPGIALKQADHDEPRFTVAEASPDPMGQGREAPAGTPWRVILISKSDTDE